MKQDNPKNHDRQELRSNHCQECRSKNNPQCNHCFCVNLKNILLVVAGNLKVRETAEGYSRGDNCSRGGTGVPQV